jgi:type II secretory ATPase GspE/PulE/Tfp pilus assembly ATPase PilB-like protein
MDTGKLDVQIYRPSAKGCRNCRHTEKADASMIRRACAVKGMSTLRQFGVQRVLAGDTTIEELLRVTQEDIL